MAQNYTSQYFTPHHPSFSHKIPLENLQLRFRQSAPAGIDLGQDKLALQRLREASEVAKVELSSKARLYGDFMGSNGDLIGI